MSDQCIICGSPIIYAETPEEMTCSVCGQVFSATSHCVQGHFVCDDCHATPAEAVIRAIANQTTSKNPLEIANEMMHSPAIHMHGPEHHFLVGAALFAAYKNAGGAVSDTALSAIITRGKKVPGGFCGMAGCCGAAVSAGIFYAVITKSTPLSAESWAQAHQLTARCLDAISRHGGPRCCKRDSFLAIQTAVAFVEETIGIQFNNSENACNFSTFNSECLQELCPYYSE